MPLRSLRWFSVTAIFSLVSLGCAHDQPKPRPPPPPRANVSGMTVYVAPPSRVETTSEDCTKGESALMGTLPGSLQKAAEKALTAAGFTVVTSESEAHALVAKLDATLGYCSASEAHIATGEAGISLIDGSRVVTRVAQSGDLASPLDSIFARAVDDLVHAPPVIDYSKAHAAQ